jgi:hypothetical protein
MIWRFFEPNDLEWLVNVSKKHHEESDWSEVEYSEDKVKGYIDTALKDPNYFAIVVEKDGEKIGFMVGRLLEYSFSHEKFARELDLYVVPSKRKGMSGIFMMKKFMDWAKINNAIEVLFEPRLSDGAIKKFDAMAKRLGMEHFANAYRRKL